MATKTKIEPEGDHHLDENHPHDGSALAPRQCTDVFCLLIFIAYLGGMGYVMNIGVQNGNPRRLTHGMDYKGALCGVDPEVADQSFLYWCPSGPTLPNGFPTQLDLSNPVCVHECPTNFATHIACLGPTNTAVEKVGTAPYVMIKTVIVQTMMDRLSYPTMELAGLYCVPAKQMLDDAAALLPRNDTLTESLMGPNGPLGTSAFGILVNGLGSVKRAWPVLIASAGLALVLSYVHLFVVRTAAKLIVNISILIINLFFWSVAIFFLIGQVLTGDLQAKWQQANWLYHQNTPDDAAHLSLVVGCSGLLLGIISLLVYCLAKEAIDAAVAVVRASCDCVFGVPSMLLQPVLEAVSKIGLFAVLLFGLAWLVSCAKPVADTITVKGVQIGGLTRSFELTDDQKYMVAYYVFGAMWIMELSNAMATWIVSYTVILWYYTPKPKGLGPSLPLVRSFLIGTAFHLGSLAFGSFLITVCRALRIILGYIARQAKAGGNRVAELIATACMCLITCFQKYLEFINKNAYIDICISSSSFCTAAMHAMGFMASEGGKILILMGAMAIVTVTGVLAITLSTGALTLLLVTSNERWTAEDSSQHVSSPYFLAGVAGLIGLVVSVCFAVVLDHAADTLLYVYCWNKAHGHNTAEKYVPDSLAALAGYKPKQGTADKSSSSSGGGFWGTLFGSQHPQAAETEKLIQKS